MSLPAPRDRVLSFALVAVAFETVFWLLLYFRPTPLGRPFALDPSRYVFHAVYFGAWAHALSAVPFLWWAQRRASGRMQLAHAAQLGLATLLLVSGVVDRECQRFLGMHASLSWLRTYTALDRTPGVVIASLGADRGGAWSSVLELAACFLYPLVAWLVASRVHLARIGARTLWGLCLVFLVIPTLRWNLVKGGTVRLAKIRPALLLLGDVALGDRPSAPSRRALRGAIATYQRHQATLDTRQLWNLSDPKHPLRKHYVGPPVAPPERRPNFIVLQLETFRARDMKSMNPALPGAPPTPFLDALSRDPKSGSFQRYVASGIPTVYAFMAIHASLLHHPHRSIPAESTTLRIDGFPELLRRAGYRTLHFTGADPDWDSQRVWLDRWYDEVHFDPSRDEDRAVFRAAAARIRDVAREQQPFLAYLVSISNHTPFEAPEPAFARPGTSSVTDALHGTMRYTDDVVRELFEALQKEPWFADTIWIITGDHAFDLGERGAAGSHNNLRHETTWVPLIVHGSDARLPRGRVSCVGSHLDLAPTILELAGVFEDNSYMGRSLLDPDCSVAEALILRGKSYALETATHSLFKPASGRALVYAAADLLQEHPLDVAPEGFKKRAAMLARAFETVLVYAVDEHRVVPEPSAGSR